MCVLCLEIEADRMRAYDVRLALSELSHTLSPDHIEELIEKLYQLEQEEENDVE